MYFLKITKTSMNYQIEFFLRLNEINIYLFNRLNFK